MQMHVTVEFFEIPALPPLHYRAEESAARRFCAEMIARHGRAVVRLDRAVTASMRLLPCHQLFGPLPDPPEEPT
ncbi:hypothetical protein D7D52_34935 [Nocardia yunnanensis]|uniref:Uncharacterized protein n=1 Tax=Nocardia yunnanensis TaxID=2382165 RepID=A0A386ZL71_9NOCA|nr:hypothetical protein [Nocardia yunnanensis]AYF78168.1 hypothetical protein D7D52_34935 [Nocardia yunnanensis]